MNPGDRSPTLTFVILILTGLTGIVDAESFLSFGHVFTANMTGNVVFIAFAVAGVPGLSVARSGTALVGFLGGATLGARMALRVDTRDAMRVVATALFVQTASLVAATVLVIGRDDWPANHQASLYVVIALTALAMGVQNATALKLAVPGLTPNVLSAGGNVVVASLSCLTAGGRRRDIGRLRVVHCPAGKEMTGATCPTCAGRSDRRRSVRLR